MCCGFTLVYVLFLKTHHLFKTTAKEDSNSTTSSISVSVSSGSFLLVLVAVLVAQ